MSDPIRQDARDLARDAFREDMSRHQRMVGQMPTPRENDRLLADALERSERRRSERKTAPATKVDAKPVRKADQIATERGYRIIRQPDVDSPLVQRALNPMEKQFAKRLDARVQLLMGKRDRGPFNQPSWRERVMAAMVTSLRDPRRGCAELLAVCEESSEKFGDWKKDSAKPLHFT